MPKHRTRFKASFVTTDGHIGSYVFDTLPEMKTFIEQRDPSRKSTWVFSRVMTTEEEIVL